MSPSVLALDLSMTATGVALPGGQLATWRPTVDGDSRLVELADHLEATLRAAPIDLVVIEGPVTRTQAATVIGMVHGAVRTILVRRNMPYALVAPASLKSYATGKGNSPKPDMRMELYKRTGADIPDDNQVDAAWLRLMAIDYYTGVAVVPIARRCALAKVTWPDLAGLAA